MAIRTAEARRAYRLVRRNWEALSDFEEPEALVSFLTAREGDSHVKDGLLAGLVTLVQMGASARFFVALGLLRFGGQVDYAASLLVAALRSYSTGLT
nr:hypothetical protein [Corallococcus exiguus]